MESSYHLSFGGLPTECYTDTAGLPAGSTCIEKSQSSYRIEMKKENHLFYGIESWDRQVTCSERKMRAHATWPFKDGPKKSEGFLNFFFLISVQTKLSLQSSEFLLTKDREIADNVHQGPLSVNFDDEWFCAELMQKQIGFF
jgi:hypothetical protein